MLIITHLGQTKIDSNTTLKKVSFILCGGFLFVVKVINLPWKENFVCNTYIYILQTISSFEITLEI